MAAPTCMEGAAGSAAGVAAPRGRVVGQVREINGATQWETTGLLKFEDVNGDPVLNTTGNTETNQVTIDRDIIVLSTSEVAKLSPVVDAPAATGGRAAAPPADIQELTESVRIPRGSGTAVEHCQTPRRR